MQTNQDGRTIVHLYCEDSNNNESHKLIEDNKEYLDIQDKIGWTALHIACSNQHENIVEALIKAGCNLNLRDALKWTPLHIACHTGNPIIVKQLLDAGAEILVLDLNNRMPLHIASRNNIENVLEILYHCDDINKILNAQTRQGFTPLHCACESNSVDIVSLLLELDADYNLTTQHNEKPIDLAVMYNSEQIVKLFKNKYAYTYADNLNLPFELSNLIVDYVW